MTRVPPSLRLAVGLLLAALVAVAAILGATGRGNDDTGAAVVNGPTAVDALTYSVQRARPLDDVGDRATIRALPRSQRRATRDTVLLGVFITVTNTSGRPLPMARRLTLVDADRRTFAPIPLTARSPFAYRPRTLAPGSVAPPAVSPAAEDLDEGGYALVFRVPRRDDGRDALSLRIDDPTGRTPPASIPVLA